MNHDFASVESVLWQACRRCGLPNRIVAMAQAPHQIPACPGEKVGWRYVVGCYTGRLLRVEMIAGSPMMTQQALENEFAARDVSLAPVSPLPDSQEKLATVATVAESPRQETWRDRPSLL